eukprot:TRINITY_DN32390_c0_g1_i5.p1 TRINITY_DN32390_c0_g1~~TRINITY_DN32390_c0_g1_i5.p1  ORF type:complete len:423 (-),score=-17.42 TRINITY_DN32390_c0_g1_i5:370-1638(-)
MLNLFLELVTNYLNLKNIQFNQIELNGCVKFVYGEMVRSILTVTLFIIDQDICVDTTIIYIISWLVELLVIVRIYVSMGILCQLKLAKTLGLLLLNKFKIMLQILCKKIVARHYHRIRDTQLLHNILLDSTYLLQLCMQKILTVSKFCLVVMLSRKPTLTVSAKIVNFYQTCCLILFKQNSQVSGIGLLYLWYVISFLELRNILLNPLVFQSQYQYWYVISLELRNILLNPLVLQSQYLYWYVISRELRNILLNSLVFKSQYKYWGSRVAQYIAQFSSIQELVLVLGLQMLTQGRFFPPFQKSIVNIDGYFFTQIETNQVKCQYIRKCIFVYMFFFLVTLLGYFYQVKCDEQFFSHASIDLIVFCHLMDFRKTWQVELSFIITLFSSVCFFFKFVNVLLQKGGEVCFQIYKRFWVEVRFLEE